MSATNVLTPQEIISNLKINFQTGEMFWLIDRNLRVKAGDRAGTLHTDGYRNIKIDGKQFLEHRLIYIVAHGSILPGYQIDHINGKRDDNRLSNLRAVTHQANHRNRSMNSRNTSGFPGVFETPSGNWGTQIKVSGKLKYLGTFPTREAAYLTYAREVAVEGYDRRHITGGGQVHLEALLQRHNI